MLGKTIGSLVRPYIIGAVIAAVLVAAGSIYWLGGAHQASKAVKRSLNALTQSIKDWNNATNEAARMDDYRACIAISGGMPNDCEQFLRNQPAATGE